MPEPGSVIEQTPWLMDCLEVTRRAWLIFAWKPANKMEWDSNDRDFIAWVGTYGE